MENQKAPGATLLTISGVWDIIIGIIFLVLGLITFGTLRANAIILLIAGPIVILSGFDTLKKRSNLEKAKEVRMTMIFGAVVIVGVSAYFFAVGDGIYPLFLLTILIPQIIGMVGAHQNVKVFEKIHQPTSTDQ